MSAPFQIIGPSSFFFFTLRFSLHNRSDGATLRYATRSREKNKLTAGRNIFMNKSDRRCGCGGAVVRGWWWCDGVTGLP